MAAMQYPSASGKLYHLKQDGVTIDISYNYEKLRVEADTRAQYVGKLSVELIAIDDKRDLRAVAAMKGN